VLRYFRASGYKTYIVTGGGQDFVRVYAERVYGIPPEQVVGTAIAETEQRRRLEALGFDVGVMSTCDPATVLWTSCVLDGIGADPDRHKVLFHNEYVQGDVNNVSALARTPSGVGTLSALPDDVRANSPRAAFLASLGGSDEMRVALRIDGVCWGTLIGYKAGGRFTAESTGGQEPAED